MWSAKELLDLDKLENFNKELEALRLKKLKENRRKDKSTFFAKLRKTPRVRLGKDFWVEHFKWIKKYGSNSKWRKKWKKNVQKEKLSRCPRTYKKYITSNFWGRRKNDWYQKFGRKCVVCGSSEFVNLHHIVYKKFGEEKDEHLVCFCRNHHEKFHKLYGVKHSMVRETKEFINVERGLLELKNDSM